MTNFWQDLPRPFFILAPMEAVTDVVFRHVVAQAAKPDLFLTEFTNASSYASEKGNFSTRGRLTFTEDEQPMVAQIWGNRPDQFAFMVKGLAKQGFAGIDINMGCPAKDVVKKDAGSGLIKKPELAAELIAAAKEGGLPVSVKTRLGYSSVDEWHDWLAHILEQDVVNLTIHLRTKKEMSKVPAHFELIPEIKKLRDEIAPHTLLTINGDIRDRQHGMELIEEYGIDGIMIGRGIFQNPFAFEKTQPAQDFSSSLPPLVHSQGHSTGGYARPWRSARPAGDIPSNEQVVEALQQKSNALPQSSSSGGSIQEHLQPELKATPGPEFEPGAKPFLNGSEPKGEQETTDRTTLSADSRTAMGSSDNGSGHHSKEELLNLLRLHLDLFDKYTAELGPRHFEPLKRFFKIYVRDFPGASELRDKLMHTKSTEEVRLVLKEASENL